MVTTFRTITPGQFTGEVSMLSGRLSLVTLRVREAGEFIEVDREKLRAWCKPTPS
jgi:hypothetical protein